MRSETITATHDYVGKLLSLLSDHARRNESITPELAAEYEGYAQLAYDNLCDIARAVDLINYSHKQTALAFKNLDGE